MEKTKEFGIAAKRTGKVFPKTFKTEIEAEKYLQKFANPDHWKIVWREVTKGEWQYIV